MEINELPDGATQIEFVAHLSSRMEKGFPDVPTKDDIDIDALVEGDDHPTFVTLPIAQIGGMSDDGFIYTEPFVIKMRDSIINGALTANLGHISPSERRNSYPIPVGYWVGAKLEPDGKLWGKVYVTDDEVAKMVNHTKSMNGSIATSIYGTYPTEALAHLDDGWTVVPSMFTMEHIDFAPPTRAALQIEDRKMKVTNHMTNVVNGDDMQTKTEIIAQLKPSDLPESLLTEVRKEDVAELAQMKAENSELKSAVATLTDETTALKDELFTKRVDALVHTAVGVESPILTKYVKALVLAQAKSTMSVEELSQVVENAVGSEDYKEMATQALMKHTGGKAFTSVATTETKKTTADEFDSEEGRAAIAGKFGINIKG